MHSIYTLYNDIQNTQNTPEIQTFLSHVCPQNQDEWDTPARLNQLSSQDILSKRYNDPILIIPDSVMTEFMDIKGITVPVTSGYKRGVIANASLPELKYVVSYMLKHNLLPIPLDYLNYEQLKNKGPEDRGKEILLHLLLGEDEPVIDIIYQLLGRTSLHRLEKNKKKREAKSLSLGDNNGGDSIQDYPFQLKSQSQQQQQQGNNGRGGGAGSFKGAYMTEIPGGQIRLLYANLGTTKGQKHPGIYLERPVFRLGSRYINQAHNFVDLRGEELDEDFDVVSRYTPKYPEDMKQYQLKLHLIGKERRKHNNIMTEKSSNNLEQWQRLKNQGQYEQFSTPEGY